jgi:hypothetical protein
MTYDEAVVKDFQRLIYEAKKPKDPILKITANHLSKLQSGDLPKNLTKLLKKLQTKL